MTNSYGVTGIPEYAEYGVYDTENAEWTGDWFRDKASAQKAAEELDDPRLGVVSTTGNEDWLEGGQKTASVIIRDLPSEVVMGLDAIKGNLSREEFLRRKLAEIVEAGEVPLLRHGHGLRAFAPSGGKARLVQYVESVGGGAADLTQEEFDAYKRARLVADPRNGGDWAKAKGILDAAGFEVFWD